MRGPRLVIASPGGAAASATITEEHDCQDPQCGDSTWDHECTQSAIRRDDVTAVNIYVDLTNVQYSPVLALRTQDNRVQLLDMKAFKLDVKV